MNFVYSPKRNLFYETSQLWRYESAGSLPDDIVEVEDAIFLKFTGDAPAGKSRGAVDGQPAWVNIAPLTPEQLIEQAEYERSTLLSAADAVMLDWRTELLLDQISDENKSKLSLWLAYKNDVKAVDVSTAYVWPTPPEA